MKKNLYIFSNTIIKRKANTIMLESVCINETANEDCINENDNYETSEFINELKEEYLLGEDILLPAGDKKYIPVENIYALFSFGTLRFNSRFLYFLSRHQIPLHIFNINGSYAGSFLPENTLISGNTLIKQTDFFKHKIKRLEIAKAFIEGAIGNAIVNLKYYFNRGAHVSDFIEQLTEIKNYISTAYSIEELMGLEGTAKKIYYASWRHIFNYPVDFTSRKKNPPNNLINALISYCNMVVYSVCLNEIFHTRLYAEIGFLHQPGENRTSLSFDLAEIFKPIITDRIIFKVINKNMISESDAVIRNRKCFLKKNAKQTFAAEIQNKLTTKIQLEGKTVKYSYRRIIREECYKLIKHFNEEQKYTPYISKW